MPGDKSISHRAALIAALARGDSQLRNFSSSSDCAATLDCLGKLGVRVERLGNDVRVRGVGTGGLSAPADPLDCGNSGSTMRMLAGVLAAHEFSSILTGDDSLRLRPMRRIIEPLELMGTQVASENGYPPLRIAGRKELRALSYELPIASAQVKTCLLLAGLHAHGRTEVVERTGSTRDHTERMLRWFGVSLELESEPARARADAVSRCAVNGPVSFDGREVRIPGDFSSAAFLIAAAALVPGSDLEIENLGLNPSRIQLLDTLRAVGADIEVVETREECDEPVGTLRILGSKAFDEADCALQDDAAADRLRRSTTISGSASAALIDELPLLAVVGTQLPGGIVIRDAGELRFKETDRITATVTNLRAMGAEVEEYEDGLVINGPVKLKGAVVDSFGDHRIAMAFAVAALLGEGASEIRNSACVSVSFPEFFECLESVVER